MIRLLAACLWVGCAGLVSAQDFTTLKGHGGPIMGIAVSQTGQVATASFDNAIGLWQDRSPTWLDGHDAAVSTLVYADAETILSGGDDFRVLLWRDAVSDPLELTRHKGKISAVRVSPDAAQIVSASWDGSIHLMHGPARLRRDASPPDPVTMSELRGHDGPVTDVAFFPQGGLVSASSDGTLRVWEGETAEALHPRVLVRHGFGVNRIIAAQDWLAYGAVDGGTRVIDPQTGEQIADFTLDRRPILSMAYHAGSGQLAVGDGHGYIMMIDTVAWRITRDFRATRKGPVWALAFSPDGRTVYAGGLDDVAYAWPVASLDTFDPAIDGARSFLRAPSEMSNGERQFMRKCSICHALEPGPSRKAGPTLHGVFGRKAGALSDYRYSDTLDGSAIIWDDTTIDALFDEGPDHYIPGSKMPMQVIAQPDDRADLIAFLKTATQGAQDQP